MKKRKNEYFIYLINQIKETEELLSSSMVMPLTNEWINDKIQASNQKEKSYFEKMINAFITPFDKEDLFMLSSLLNEFLLKIKEIIFIRYLLIDNINQIEVNYLTSINKLWSDFVTKIHSFFPSKAKEITILCEYEKKAKINDNYLNCLKDVFFNEHHLNNKMKRILLIETIKGLQFLMIEIYRTLIKAILKSI